MAIITTTTVIMVVIVIMMLLVYFLRIGLLSKFKTKSNYPAPIYEYSSAYEPATWNYCKNELIVAKIGGTSAVIDTVAYFCHHS